MLGFHNTTVKQVAIISAAVVASLVLAGAANKKRTGEVFALRETTKHEFERLQKYRGGIKFRIAELGLKMAKAELNDVKAMRDAATQAAIDAAEAYAQLDKSDCDVTAATARVEAFQKELDRLSEKANSPKTPVEGEPTCKHCAAAAHEEDSSSSSSEGSPLRAASTRSEDGDAIPRSGDGDATATAVDDKGTAPTSLGDASQEHVTYPILPSLPPRGAVSYDPHQ